MKKRRRKIRKFRFAVFLLMAFAIIYFCSLDKEQKERLIKKSSFLSTLIKESKKQKAIKECLSSTEVPEDVRNDVATLENDLKDYLTKYNVGFKYQEKTLDYELAYRSDSVFYGASLIKLVDANYLLDKDIDLAQTKKYEDKHKMAYSSGVSAHKIGDEISLKELLTYAISVSDNSAHLMLIDYIGFTNLQEYGKSLGGKVILEGGDLFGNQTADDMIVYLNKAYELINNKENGSILKEAMINTEVNYLNFDDVIFAHKYGSYSYYFHDVGIYFSDNPYLIAILTTSDNNKTVVTEISKKVYNIHKVLLEAKNNYCYNISN